MRKRIAVCAYVGEQVIKTYSEYFRKKFKQPEAIRCAWKYAGGANPKASELQRVSDATADLIDDIHDEHYAVSAVSIGPNILEEIEKQDGKAADISICDAALAYFAQLLYRQGYSVVDPRIPRELQERFEDVVFSFAEQVTKRAKELSTDTVRRSNFAGLTLPEPDMPVPREALLKTRWSPRVAVPVHERRGPS